MLTVDFGNRFKKDFKKIQKRGKDKEKLYSVIELLKNQEKLPEKFRNHKLTGNWVDFWECHIEPDWLLVYKIENNVLFLAATGTHSDLFK